MKLQVCILLLLSTVAVYSLNHSKINRKNDDEFFKQPGPCRFLNKADMFLPQTVNDEDYDEIVRHFKMNLKSHIDQTILCLSELTSEQKSARWTVLKTFRNLMTQIKLNNYEDIYFDERKHGCIGLVDRTKSRFSKARIVIKKIIAFKSSQLSENAYKFKKLKGCLVKYLLTVVFDYKKKGFRTFLKTTAASFDKLIKKLRRLALPGQKGEAKKFSLLTSYILEVIKQRALGNID